jgi:uncharacterized protein YaiI (UPF0178 family)
MQIWVDADACPKVIKDILFRAAERRRIPLILVANKPLKARGVKGSGVFYRSKQGKKRLGTKRDGVRQ